jgi:L-alanine-DL-glutamate epimerase-like enolase superfamily enzyme
MWLEDMLTGDYVPWVNPQAYRELTVSTKTPIHTGEQIYLRHNFKELIETQAVRVVGPDPADIGGIAELKWVAEHAYMHNIMMAPHGTANGLLGLGALINVCATLPANYIAFEYPSASEPFWNDIVTGLPPAAETVKNSHVDLLPGPGLGVDIDAKAAKRFLKEEDAGFFD